MNYRITTDTNCFYGKFTSEETIVMLAEAGFDGIVYSPMDACYWNGEKSLEERKAHYAELKKFAEGYGICFNQSHAPCPSSTKDPVETEKIFQNIVRSIENASFMGAKELVVHPLNHLEHEIAGNKEKTFELNMEFYNRLKPYCEEYEVCVGLENVTDYRNTMGGHRFFPTTCSCPEELLQYLEELNSDCFFGCLDIGHAIVVHQNPVDFIHKLGHKWLHGLHIHDSNGHMDSHTLPYLGMADWDAITKALKEIQYEGDFGFEAGNFLKPLPKELCPMGSKMLYETGKYLVGKIQED